MNIWSNIFRHHRWSNRVVIDFLAGLTDDQLELSVPGTYGGSLATIRHIVSADADYLRIIPAAPDVTQISDHDEWGGWDELRSVAWEAGSAYVDHVDGLADDAFFSTMTAARRGSSPYPSCWARSSITPPSIGPRSGRRWRRTASRRRISVSGAGTRTTRVARCSTSCDPSPDPSAHGHLWFAVTDDGMLEERQR